MREDGLTDEFMGFFVKSISIKAIAISLLIFNGILISYHDHTNKNFTIMLDPAGDAQNTGRQIDDYLERGITLQFAEKLKEKLEHDLNGISVVLTRRSGETIQPLENANFANRFDVDFYVSIHFYKEKEVKPKLYLYTFSYNDDFITKKPDLHFYPYDKAHLINKDKTKQLANVVKNAFLCDTYNKLFDVVGLFRLPFKPLIGVKAPAIGIELGLRQKDDWKRYVDIFASVVSQVIDV